MSLGEIRRLLLFSIGVCPLQFAKQLSPSGKTQAAIPAAVRYATPGAPTLRTTLPDAIRAVVSRDEKFR